MKNDKAIPVFKLGYRFFAVQASKMTEQAKINISHFFFAMMTKQEENRRKI